MTFVVVIANSGKPSKIYKGADIMRLLRAARKDHAKRYVIRTRVGDRTKRVTVGWNAEMDLYLVAHYRESSRSELASHMSIFFKRKITKGSLMTRCRLLGLCERKV